LSKSLRAAAAVFEVAAIVGWCSGTMVEAKMPWRE